MSNALYYSQGDLQFAIPILVIKKLKGGISVNSKTLDNKEYQKLKQWYNEKIRESPGSVGAGSKEKQEVSAMKEQMKKSWIKHFLQNKKVHGKGYTNVGEGDDDYQEAVNKLSNAWDKINSDNKDTINSLPTTTGPIRNFGDYKSKLLPASIKKPTDAGFLRGTKPPPRSKVLKDYLKQDINKETKKLVDEADAKFNKKLAELNKQNKKAKDLTFTKFPEHPEDMPYEITIKQLNQMKQEIKGKMSEQQYNDEQLGDKLDQNTIDRVANLHNSIFAHEEPIPKKIILRRSTQTEPVEQSNSADLVSESAQQQQDAPDPIPQQAPPPPPDVPEQAPLEQEQEQQPPIDPDPDPNVNITSTTSGTSDDKIQLINKQSQEVQKTYGEKDKKDDIKDLSKYGYQMQVSKFAIEEARDFSFTKELIKTSSDAPNTDASIRKKQIEDALKIYGFTIGIQKSKTNDYDEACEIMAFIFLALEKYRFQRKWKKAIIEMPEILESSSQGGGSQVGAVVNIPGGPQLLSNVINQSTQSESQSTQSQSTQYAEPEAESTQFDDAEEPASGDEMPPPPPTPPIKRGRARSRSSPSRDRSRSRPAPLQSSRPLPASEQAGGAQGTSSLLSDASTVAGGNDRRRLSGMEQNIGFTTAKMDRIERNKQTKNKGMVRHNKPQSSVPRPFVNYNKLNYKPDFHKNTIDDKKRMRINSNLLFTNIDKQNPTSAGEDNKFKISVPKFKKLRRFKL